VETNSPDRDAFERVFRLVEPLPGWLTRDQARVLWDEATGIPRDGRIVEIGSHCGRSTVVLASACPAGLTAVDPFEADWKYGGPDTKAHFEANLAAAGVADKVRLEQTTSTKLRPNWPHPIDLLYIDGKHDYWTVSDDLRWASHLTPGGRVLIHDSFSSVGVTLALLRHVLPGHRLRYLDRTGSLARFEVAQPSRADRLRIVAELPWWVRNVAIKILLRLRLSRVTLALGHQGAVDPF
jgi:hypothetical protein